MPRLSQTCAAAMLVLLPGFGAAQVAGYTAQLGGDPFLRTNTEIVTETYLKEMPALTDEVTRSYLGAISETAGNVAKRNANAARQIVKVAKKLHEAGRLNLPEDTLKTFGKSLDEAKDLDSFNKFTGKVNRVLKILDIVSTGSKAAGYLVEGDATGASHVVIKDIIKKSSEGAAMFGLSWVPGGQVAGAIAGEAFFKKHLEPEINAGEKNARLKEYRKKYLNKPCLPVRQILRPNPQTGKGEIVTLDPDMYYDAESGLFKRRPPEEQAEYEAEARRIWKAKNRMADFWRQYERGEISRDELDLLRQSFKDRDPDEPWEPDLDDLKDEAGLEDEAEGAPYTSLDEVKHQKVVAGVAFKDEWFDIDTTVRFSFWNIGALYPGRGEATVTITSSGEGESSTETFGGTFSGGPNGVFHIEFPEEGSVQFQLSGGRVIIPSDGSPSLTVQNPGAFARWPE